MMGYSYSQHKKWLLMPGGMNTQKKCNFLLVALTKNGKLHIDNYWCESQYHCTALL